MAMSSEDDLLSDRSDLHDRPHASALAPIRWDSLGDPYGDNARLVVLSFASEAQAAKWAEVIGSTNAPAFKTARVRRVQETLDADSAASGAVHRQPSFKKKTDSEADNSGQGSSDDGSGENTRQQKRHNSMSKKGGCLDMISEGVATPESYSNELAMQGFNNAVVWERLCVSVPVHADGGLQVRVKGVWCKGAREKPSRKKNGKGGSKGTASGKATTVKIDARIWTVVTGFLRRSDGREGAAERSGLIRPLDIIVSIDNTTLPDKNFLACVSLLKSSSASCSPSMAGAAGDETKNTQLEDSNEVVMTLWRNSSAVPPLAEGWVPYAVSTAVRRKISSSSLSISSGLSAAWDALHGPSPRRYLFLSEEGVLRIHLPAEAAQGSFVAEPVLSISLKDDVHSLQKARDDGTDRWQLILWHKVDADSGKLPTARSGVSTIVAFKTEDEMMQWLTVLSSTRSYGTRPDEDNDSPTNGNGAAKKRSLVQPDESTLPVVSEVLTIRPRENRRLSRVNSSVALSERSGAAARRTTAIPLDAMLVKQPRTFGALSTDLLEPITPPFQIPNGNFHFGGSAKRAMGTSSRRVSGLATRRRK